MQQLLQALDAQLSLAATISNKVHVTNSAGAYVNSLEERQIISQAAFVQMFISFESFLEAAFKHYGMRGLSATGTAPRCFVSAPNGEHFTAMLIGTRPFADWSNPQTVRKLASLFFKDGEPFETALASVHSDLVDLKTVRNAASHVSSTTGHAAAALMSRWTSRPTTSASAYDILTSVGGSSAQTFMSYSEFVLRRTARSIAGY